MWSLSTNQRSISRSHYYYRLIRAQCLGQTDTRLCLAQLRTSFIPDATKCCSDFICIFLSYLNQEKAASESSASVYVRTNIQEMKSFIRGGISTYSLLLYSLNLIHFHFPSSLIFLSTRKWFYSTSLVIYVQRSLNYKQTILFHRSIKINNSSLKYFP